MRRLIVSLAVIALLISPAYAQKRQKNKEPDSSQQTEDKKKQKAAKEKAYKDALHSIPEQKPTDPWAKMR